MEGSVAVKGDVAFVSQIPWVHSGTVRSNILFGDDYLPERWDLLPQWADRIVFPVWLGMTPPNLFRPVSTLALF
jgi:hypothetical protein